MDKNYEEPSMLIIASELLFAVIPLLILLLIAILTPDNLVSIFKRSDISFVSVLLFGQTLVKLISGYVKIGNQSGWQRFAFIITLLFIFGIIPSVIYLIIVHLEISNLEIVYILQNIWLILSIIVYIIFGCIGQMKLDEKNDKYFPSSSTTPNDPSSPKTKNTCPNHDEAFMNTSRHVGGVTRVEPP
jgi:hypothetical protein